MQPHELEATLGETLAREVMATCGAQRVYVPQRVLGSALAATVGISIAQQLAAEFGGQTIWVPRAPSPRLRDKVRRLLATGLSRTEVIRHAGCSERTVSRANYNGQSVKDTD